TRHRIAVTEQHQHVAVVVADGEVEGAVAVDVAHGQPARRGAGVGGEGAHEPAAAVADKDLDAGPRQHGDVEPAVAVEIGGRGAAGRVPGVERESRDGFRTPPRPVPRSSEKRLASPASTTRSTVVSASKWPATTPALPSRARTTAVPSVACSPYAPT